MTLLATAEQISTAHQGRVRICLLATMTKASDLDVQRWTVWRNGKNERNS